MIDTIIKGVVLAVVLFAVYWLVGLLFAALGWPEAAALVIGILLALCFLAWVLKAFGIGF